MATIRLQLHQSLDGRTFSSKDEAKEHNDKLATESYNNIRKMIHDHTGLSQFDLDLIMDMLIDKREEFMTFLKFLQ